LEYTTVHHYNIYLDKTGNQQKVFSHTTKTDTKSTPVQRVYRYFDAEGNIEKTKTTNNGKWLKFKMPEQEETKDFEGIVQNATDAEYENNYGTALLKDITAEIWNEFYQPVIDGGTTIADPNTSAGEKLEAGVIIITTLPSSRGARRSVMRKEGIPTSQQPKSQSKNASGRNFEYEIPKKGGGTETKGVQEKTLDRGHEGSPHWEAGSFKKNKQTDNHGTKRLDNNKSKQEYNKK
jgi:hypothetical protein